MKNKRKVLIISIISSLIVLIGSSYAFFMYSKTISAFNLTSGDINIEFVNGDNNINLDYAYPVSDKFAKANLDKLSYIDFSVNGSISDIKQVIKYEIYLEEDSKNTLDSNYIKVYLTDDTKEEIVEPTTYNSLTKTTYPNSSNGKVIYKTSKSGEFNDNYRIYVWIDSSYTQNTVQERFSFKVNLYAYNSDAAKPGNEVLKETIANHETGEDVTVVDDEGIIYLSGDNAAINFNYVWYSGKLWRITALYPDGTMKMITQDDITGMHFGETDDFETSWVYDWLNEDFLDTLYNYQEIIVTDAKWELTTGYGDPPYKIVTTEVGLLNPFEFRRSIDKVNTDKLVEKFQKGYLNNGYNWWLSSHCNSSEKCIRAVTANGNNGDLGGFAPNLVNFGVRPAVILKANIVFEGEGTKNNPYKILADKPTGKTLEKLNTRISGEYVKVDNRIYRIVGIEDDKTKLVSVDYVRDATGGILNKLFANPNNNIHNYADAANLNNSDYWGSYLNNDWVTNDLKKYLVEGTYYLKSNLVIDDTGAHGTSYKVTICQDINTEETTKNCVKTDKTWSGLVGLPRIGEMFAYPIDDNPENTPNMFFITPSDEGGYYITTYIKNTFVIDSSFYTDVAAVRPTITLNPEVIITGGDGRSINTPYTIDLPNA